MTPTLERCLRRLLSGDADDADLRALAAEGFEPGVGLSDTDLAPVRDGLREVFLGAPGAFDVTDSVMDALAEDAAFDSVSAELRAAVARAGDLNGDLAGQVMETIARDEAFADAFAADLRASVAMDVDLSDDIFASLALAEAMEPISSELRAALAGSVDLSDDIMGSILGASEELPSDADAAAMEISAFADGEIAAETRAVVTRRLMRDTVAREAIRAQAELAAAVRDAVSQPVDVWDAVARSIGADEATDASTDAEWSQVAAELRSAVQTPAVDVAPAVMAAVAPSGLKAVASPVRSVPRWSSLWAPMLTMAAAAALLLALIPPTTVAPTALAPDQGASSGVIEAGATASFVLGAVNEAHVENVEYAPGVQGGILEPQNEGDVMVIVMDDSALAVADVPSGTHL